MFKKARKSQEIALKDFFAILNCETIIKAKAPPSKLGPVNSTGVRGEQMAIENV